MSNRYPNAIVGCGYTADVDFNMVALQTMHIHSIWSLQSTTECFSNPSLVLIIYSIILECCLEISSISLVLEVCKYISLAHYIRTLRRLNGTLYNGVLLDS